MINSLDLNARRDRQWDFQKFCKITEFFEYVDQFYNN